jgi:hypothetical protein
MSTDQAFFAGVLSALTVVRQYGHDAIFNEIVRSCGGDRLVEEARRSGNMRSSGLDEWLRRRRTVEAYRERRKT